MNTLSELKADLALHGLTFAGTAHDVGGLGIERPHERYAFLVTAWGERPLHDVDKSRAVSWRWAGKNCYALFPCDDYPDVTFPTQFRDES